MPVKDFFKVTRGTKVVFGITFTISLLGILFAFIYYSRINRANDPRIDTAREIIAEYDRLSAGLDLGGRMILLDSALQNLNQIEAYRNSFEPGVVYNNKCSALIVEALYNESVAEEEKAILLGLAMKYCDTSILTYKGWLQRWQYASSAELKALAEMEMDPGDLAFKGRNYKNLLNQRHKSLIEAQIETPRRLSVALSNKGIIFRHLMMPDSALNYFSQALELWGDNRPAKSNLEVLFGGEPVEPGIIEALFPPDRKKN